MFIATFLLRSGPQKVHHEDFTWTYLFGPLSTDFHEDVLFQSLDFQGIYIYISRDGVSRWAVSSTFVALSQHGRKAGGRDAVQVRQIECQKLSSIKRFSASASSFPNNPRDIVGEECSKPFVCGCPKVVTNHTMLGTYEMDRGKKLYNEAATTTISPNSKSGGPGCSRRPGR